MNPMQYVRWLKYAFNNRKDIMGLRFTSTWKCNSKCKTCSIWKDKTAGQNDLTPAEIDKFTRSKYFRKTRYITISGGEPTMREDLSEVITILHRNIPTAKFGITTHGMNPDLGEKVFRSILKKNPKINFGLVGLSLNGPPEIHDSTRGIPGCWDKTVETYDRLKNLVHCEFSFTFCKENVDYFDWVQDFAKKRGTKAYICWTVMNERFQVSDQDLVFWKKGMDAVLEGYLKKSCAFPRTLLQKIAAILTLPSGVTFGCLYDCIINRRIMPCYAGSQIVHVDPSGDVYPCNFKLSPNRILGNLRTAGFDEIWESLAPSILKDIKNGECMYPNGLCGDSDIYPSLCNCPPFLVKWYLRKLLTGAPLVKASNNDQQRIPGSNIS